MILEGLVWKVYQWSEWIMRIMYVNLLWVLFSCLGLLVFGIFPATCAMFAVTRKWMLGEKNVPVFKTFWGYYKDDFLRANFLGYLLVMIGAFLYVDLRFSRVHRSRSFI